MNAGSNKTWVMVDVETTGGSPEQHRIIELGAIRVQGGKVTGAIRTLINPNRPIPEFITKITGIRSGDVADAPQFYEIADAFTELCADATFVAHNALFDFGFIKQEYDRIGKRFAVPVMCTVRLSRHLYPEYRHHNLSALIERFGFNCEKRHRAFDDAHVLWQFMRVIKKQFPHEAVEEAIHKSYIKSIYVN